MHISVRTRLAALLLAATSLAACSTDRAGVTAPAGASLGVAGAHDAALDSVKESHSQALEATALTRKSGLDQDQYAAAYIDPKRGGTLEIKSAGLSVNVPAGAVSAPMIIWVKAPAGNLVSYEFGPHGTQFLLPLTVRQDLRPTGWYKLLDRSQVEVGYFKDPAQVDRLTGRAMIDEFLPITVQSKANRIEFQILHFSGYLLSTGKTCKPCTT
jgi:hypothetical protein